MNKRKVVMLFAILVGVAVAAIINRQQIVKADKDDRRTTIDPNRPDLNQPEPKQPIVEAGCFGNRKNVCFTESFGGKKRTVKGTYRERTY